LAGGELSRGTAAWPASGAVAARHRHRRRRRRPARPRSATCYRQY